MQSLVVFIMELSHIQSFSPAWPRNLATITNPLMMLRKVISGAAMHGQ